MAELGFWNFAQQDPKALALVGPDGREWTRGELFARANQVAHGLRALGLGKGDCVALVLPNCAEFYAINLAVAQIGLYMTPINNHLTGPEIGDRITPDSILLLPIGAVEQHGPHLPLAVDHVIAHETATAVTDEVGDELDISVNDVSAQGRPEITALPDGGFIVYWQSSDPATGDTDLSGIAARRYGAAGNPVGGEFLVNSNEVSFQTDPAGTG